MSEHSHTTPRHFILLVGINDYPAPISKLSGCIRDINRVEKFLIEKFGQGTEVEKPLANKALAVKNYGNLNICRLENQSATYNNIVDGFRQFLGQAKKDDVVWFHFSGHGTEVYCAEEFLKIEPNGKDQSLVCYHKSDEDGQPFLADKELAILIDELSKGDVEPPHIVVSTDCCHSGSITRDEYKTRKYGDSLPPDRSNAGSNVARKLDSYLDGFYAKQWEEKGAIHIPLGRHIAITACENIELATELPEGGMFTNGLMDTLELTQGNVSYRDLFMQARSVMRRNRRKLKIHQKQTPKFFTYRNFNPSDSFLKSNAGKEAGRSEETTFSKRYELNEDGVWYIMCGVIHGIPADFDEPIQVEILESAFSDKVIGRGEIVYAGAIKSEVELDDSIRLDTDETYFATIRHIPTPPKFIKIEGEERGIKRIRQSWFNMMNTTLAEDEADEEIAFAEIQVSEDEQFAIYDRNFGKRVWATGDIMALKIAIHKIFQWHRFADLVNEDSMIQDWVDFEMGVTLKNKETEYYKGEELTFYVSEDTFMSHGEALFARFIPRVRIHNLSETLYMYLFWLRPSYEIKCLNPETVFRPEEHEGKEEILIPLLKSEKGGGWGLSAEDMEAECCFKVLVLTEPLDYIQLEQTKIAKDQKRTPTKLKPLGMEDAWLDLSVKIRLIREIDSIQPNKQSVINDRISIQSIGSITGKLCLSSAYRNFPQQNPAAQFSELELEGFQLIDFKNEGEKYNQNILEINQLTYDPGASLEIKINHPLSENQEIVPVLFDGKDFRIAGESIYQAGTTTVKISHFPDLPYQKDKTHLMVDNPFIAYEKQHISLHQSLKIAFFLSENGVVTSIIKEPLEK